MLIALWLIYCERLLFVTPDLLRKSTPEGLVDKISRQRKYLDPVNGYESRMHFYIYSEKAGSCLHSESISEFSSAKSSV